MSSFRLNLFARHTCLLGMLLCTLGACDSKKNEPPEPQLDAGMQDASNDSKDAQAEKEARFAKLLAAAQEKLARGEDLNERDHELLLLDLKSCSVDGVRGYVDVKCQAFQTLKSARSKPNKSVPNMASMWRTLSEKHLTHESEAVRIYSTQILTASHAAGKNSYEPLLELSKSEESASVQLALVRALRTHIGRDPRVAEHLLTLSKKPDEALRESVLIGLTSLWAVGSKGTLERALEMVEKDPSMKVRKAGCANLGARADDRVMPLLERYTAWPPPEEDLYGDCLRGLLGMWSAPVPHKRPSQKAYELSIERFSAKPRTEKHPSWMAIAGFSWASKPKLLERAPWIDVEKVRGLLVELIEDHNVNWLGRNAAITALVQVGTTSKELAAVKKRSYRNTQPTGSSPDKYVLNKLDEQIERLGKVEQKKNTSRSEK